MSNDDSRDGTPKKGAQWGQSHAEWASTVRERGTGREAWTMDSQ